jgi:hypothetical protein
MGAKQSEPVRMERITLLDPPPVTSHKSRVWPITGVVLALALGMVLYFTFRYYPEKRVTQEFFDALVAGDTNKAYALWKPTPSYRMSDFMADWGPAGYYGPVKSYKIMGATTPRKSESVEVNVAVSPYAPLPPESDGEKSSKTRVVTLWISPPDKSFSFPP